MLSAMRIFSQGDDEPYFKRVVDIFEAHIDHGAIAGW